MCSIIVLHLVVRCLEIIDGCIWRVFAFNPVVVTVWGMKECFLCSDKYNGKIMIKILFEIVSDEYNASIFVVRRSATSVIPCIICLAFHAPLEWRILDALPGSNHTHGMQYQIVMNITFWTELNLSAVESGSKIVMLLNAISGTCTRCMVDEISATNNYVG